MEEGALSIIRTVGTGKRGGMREHTQHSTLTHTVVPFVPEFNPFERAKKTLHPTDERILLRSQCIFVLFLYDTVVFFNSEILKRKLTNVTMAVLAMKTIH